MILQSANELAFKPSNIISLVPSQTELLYYLGLDKEVTGITKFCVHPAEWRKTKMITGGTKNINPGIIKKLCPHLIIANKEENERDQIEELAKEYNIWVTDVVNLQDALQMIKDIGKLTGTNTKANELIIKISMAFEKLNIAAKKIRTCYLIWQKPYMAVGGDTFINDMLAKCGFENIYSNKTRYPVVKIEELKTADCELLILSSEPYPFKQKHINELQHQLPHTKIILAEGEMFSWYGSRLLKTAEYFTKLIETI
jgi:ABC-type Fe3+-hydroxamate transport system substrate-binding protein